MFAAPTIYPIVDSGACARAGLDPVSFAEACLRGGARVLQLRQKEGSSAGFLETARRIVRAAARVGAHVIVNDRADIAALSGAAGVHVGQEDLGVDDVRRVAGPSLAHVLTRVAGVVAERGGSTSHLASLARERGIPMVLGVHDATHRIPDGVQVAVDGVAGVVRWMG